MTDHDGYKVAYFPSSHGSKAQLCVVVGRSFEVDRSEGVCKPEDESEPLARIDELYEGKNPFESSIKRASDYEPIKLRVDLVLTGTAHAPGGKPAASWPVVFRVGKWTKALRVVGPRVCKYVAPKKKGKKKEPSPPRFTEAEPVSEVALRYENAFGGVGVFVPDDKEAFRAAKQKAEEVEVRARQKAAPAEAPPVEIPQMSDELWDEASDSAKPAKKTDGRRISDGLGSSDAGLELEHLSTSHEGTLELDLDQVEALGGVEAGDAASRAVDHEGTPLLALAEAGKERVVDEGWSDELVPDKERAKKKPQKTKENSEFPSIGYRSNPVGKGFAVSHDRDVIEGLELPLIEDPESPVLPENIPCNIQDLESAPQPAGLGPLARSWAPRADLAGLDPEQKEQIRGKVDEYILSLDPDDPDDRAAIVALADQDLPDHDPRVYNFAPIDQQLSEIRGDELVRVEGVSPDGPVEFKLPGRFPLATLDRGRGEELLGLKLDTVEVDTDEDRVVLVWRGRVEMEDEADLLDYPHVRVRIEDFDPESARARHAQHAQEKEGGTDILEAVGEEDVPEEHVDAKVAAPGDDGAWREGEDREVSPLSDDDDLLTKRAATKDAEQIAREKRREDVMALRAQIKEAEEAKAKKKKGRKKKPKKP